MSAIAQAIPQSVLSAFWPLIAVGLMAVVFWRMLRWFRDQIRDEINAAIEGRAFKQVVNERVLEAFGGAIAPFMNANADLAGKIANVERTANKAHERIDKHLEGHA